MARDRILERNKNVRGLSQGRGEQGGKEATARGQRCMRTSWAKQGAGAGNGSRTVPSSLTGVGSPEPEKRSAGESSRPRASMAPCSNRRASAEVPRLMG